MIHVDGVKMIKEHGIAEWQHSTWKYLNMKFKDNLLQATITVPV